MTVTGRPPAPLPPALGARPDGRGQASTYEQLFICSDVYIALQHNLLRYNVTFRLVARLGHIGKIGHAENIAPARRRQLAAIG